MYACLVKKPHKIKSNYGPKLVDHCWALHRMLKQQKNSRRNPHQAKTPFVRCWKVPIVFHRTLSIDTTIFATNQMLFIGLTIFRISIITMKIASLKYQIKQINIVIKIEENNVYIFNYYK